ncbi:GntR family transcriptional regulator [Desulfogranum mediterraneum]|uniref:GntR family transcriptional regulator n=1 Tax=Desulfogranum mediterraneum TaxID=160661 RepID=UPI000406027D|nr:GntR family transcriptional regulator [Desulfogranum mediterraneum]
MNRSSEALPLYIQIAEGLSEQIESGELAPGTRLPAERQLSASLGVTRMTLRQALQILTAEGLVERRQGSGNYIAQAKIERTTSRLNPFTAGMEKNGLNPGAEVVLSEQRPATSSLAARLRLPVSSELYYCHRLRLLNHQPSMLEKFYLPTAFFPGFEQLELTDTSVYAQLEAHYDVRIQRAEQSIEAVAASAYEAGLLQIPTGTPLLLERRVSFDQDDRAVEYAKDLYRGDRFRFLLSTSSD